jgi:hypothetical protein
MALNFGTYRLLPMFNRGTGPLRFEFFGHGIVELARLTTGKSTREIEEIAEFLVHAGYDPSHVDDFLAPLVEARGGRGVGGSRSYAATIDDRGELVNEGVVLTAPFIEELEKDIEGNPMGVVEYDGLQWAVLPVDPKDPDSLVVGMRMLGTARLKGLAPQELVEAIFLESVPGKPERAGPVRALLQTLRQIATRGTDEADDELDQETISEDLVVATFLTDGQREWVFGHYRDSDDVMLNAVEIPIQTPELERNEPLEGWLFRNRHELAQLYEGIRRSTAGKPTPLKSLRSRDGFMSCFLAAPHRAPGQR